MKFIRMIIAIACLSPVSTAFATPSDAAPPCTDSSKECMTQIATIYLDGVVSHDASKIPFTPTVTRWDNAVKTGDGPDQIRQSIDNDLGAKGIKGYRDARWFADGNDLVVFYLMDVNIPFTNIYAATTHVVDKFHIVNGQIDEIEAIFCNSMTKTPEDSKMPNQMPSVCNRALF